MPSHTSRPCLECGEPFRGRADKKFCSDICRTAFNNRLNSIDTRYVRDVNNILRKNRRILKSMNPTGRITVSCEKLKARGFDFNYFTNTWSTPQGTRYYFCYDQGYLPLENDLVLLIMKEHFRDG